MRTTYELVRDHYAANDRKDLEGMLADIAPDCRWTEMDGFPCAGTYVGPEAIVEHVFMPLGAAFDNYTFTLERLLDAGDAAVAVGNYTATHKATGKAMNVRVVHVWGASDGKIRRFEHFTDTLRVAEAMK
ncbi:nuclear transport factor 2 family protein [Rhizobium sp. KVB221]|uniref:Nuclear transport factor 2 family protein n=1 Tax=Rhizobium setariae TaxID=2801340 RepID=A0A937CPI1_9HYPH|nr:nuclear transport factor 2 family protein [Rhizobium setariae]